MQATAASLWSKLSWTLRASLMRSVDPGFAGDAYFLVKVNPADAGRAPPPPIPFEDLPPRFHVATIIAREIVRDRCGEAHEVTILADGTREVRRYQTEELRHHIASLHDQLSRQLCH